MGDLYLVPYMEHLRCSLSVVTSHVSEIGLAEGCGNFINMFVSEFKVKMGEILSDEEGRGWPSPEGKQEAGDKAGSMPNNCQSLVKVS